MLMRLLILSIALLGSACDERSAATTLDENAHLLNGRLVRPVHENSEYFMVWTHGRSGLNTDVARTLDESEIGDPAARMEAALVRYLADRVGVAGIGAPLAFGPDKPDDLAEWSRIHAVADLIIDIETQIRGFEWWSSSIVYDATFQLIDPVSGRTIAQHHCNMRSPALEHGPETPQNPFPQDDVSATLLADRSASVKTIIVTLADACLETIKSAAL